MCVFFSFTFATQNQHSVNLISSMTSPFENDEEEEQASKERFNEAKKSLEKIALKN